MMRPKFLLILLPALLLSVGVRAQSRPLSEVASHLATDRISLHYDCIFTGDAPVRLSGTLLVQGTCYRAVGNGLEIYCDGQSRWTVDPESREVYIEATEGLEELMAWRDSLTELTLTDVRYSPQSGDLSPFVFDTAGLDGAWVVTDLR